MQQFVMILCVSVGEYGRLYCAVHKMNGHKVVLFGCFLNLTTMQTVACSLPAISLPYTEVPLALQSRL
jgi:hypothetical protein